MGDSAEFEKLTMLEGRLAAALDRIAVGLGEMQAQTETLSDPVITSGELEDAAMRAEAAEAQVATLTERVEALEGRLSEAQDALAEAEAANAKRDGDTQDDDPRLAELEASVASLTEERDGLIGQIDALEAARDADVEEANRVLSDRDARIAALASELEAVVAARDEAVGALAAMPSQPATEAPKAAPLDADLEDLNEELDFARERLRRLRIERNEARQERDAAQGLIDDATAPPDTVDTRLTELRAEAARLRSANDDLLEQVSQLREAAQPRVAALDDALLAEVQALRAARASEAAELERILAELTPVLSAGDDDA